MTDARETAHSPLLPPHTPTPWFQSHRKIADNEDGMHSTEIYCKDGRTIATLAWYAVDKGNGITGTSRRANAEHIVNCVNSHQGLVDALGEIATYGRSGLCGADAHRMMEIAEEALKTAGAL